ncbi:hypothetical protein OG898_07385 [Streptomyces sp. NBC_00193]|uniref:hypothetical protein n=1 Tax=Streptomyces sp. NBC_00193 TaxID=2975675 RepID=UPI00224CFB97|nr:hypothetical protein [Streptomyces sp. NBC_00193]MCX5296313.1 hypothetical protein [Streptomyces sp. NBC_00193]
MPFLPHAYRVTKYDPADRAPDGTYRGTEDTDSDHGPVEAAYLAAVAAFAEESGIELLTVRDPRVVGAAGGAHFGREPAVEGHGLTGLSADTAGLVAGLPEEFGFECVWEDAGGRILSAFVDEEDRAELAEVLAGARAAALLPYLADEHDPLFTGVLPDDDGAVRARWQV